MLDSIHLAVVRSLIAGVPPDRHLWALTGSAGLCLQGVSIDVHDLDVQTDRATAEAIVAAFPGRVRTELHDRRSETMRSYFAVLAFDSLAVEIMGDISKRLSDGSWEPPVNVEEVRVWIDADDSRIPVVNLEHECRAYALMGRMAKVALIRGALDARKRRAEEIGES